MIGWFLRIPRGSLTLLALLLALLLAGQAAPPPSEPGERVIDPKTHKQPSLSSKRICCAWSPDLRQWTDGGVLLHGVSSPQLAMLGDSVVLLCADASGIEIHRLRDVAGGHPTIAEAQRLDIVGETSAVQVDPSLVSLPGGQGHRLYYTAVPSRVDPAFGTTEIHSATLRDGTWIRDPGLRLRGMGIVDPDVIHLADGRWRLFFTSSVREAVGSAVSADGLDFTVEPGDRVKGMVTSTVPLAGGGWLMAYHRMTHSQRGRVLGVAGSDDGFTFRPVTTFAWDPTRPNAWGEESPSILQLPDGSFFMVYVTAARWRGRS